MAITNCPDCGREISSLAPACIHCGRPAEQRAAPPAVSLAVAVRAACPLCSADVTHPHALTGGAVWCERCGAHLIYGTDGALVRATPRTPQAQPVAPVVIMGEPKSVGAAILLAFFFGPLGMLYSTTNGAMIMLLATFAAIFMTFGLGLFITWPVCVIWAANAATEHNRRLAFGVPAVL